jgi:hypothetical protein
MCIHALFSSGMIPDLGDNQWRLKNPSLPPQQERDREGASKLRGRSSPKEVQNEPHEHREPVDRPPYTKSKVASVRSSSGSSIAYRT